MDSDFDASWCIACDRLIPPKRFIVQVPFEEPDHHQDHLPSELPSAQSSSKQSKCKRLRLVQSTGRRKTTTVPQVASRPRPVHYRTVIDPGPQGLYCSDKCEMADLHSSYLGHSTQSNRAPSELIPTTLASSNKGPREYPPHVLAFAKQLNFPPLPDLKTIVYAEDDSDEELVSQPNEYTGGIIMAARRIAAILPKPMPPRTSRYDPKPEVPKPVPGWSDGSNAWRASVYYNTRLHSDASINTTPAPKVVRPTKRVKASCTEERPADPTTDLYEKFNECMSRRIESRLSPTSPAPLPDFIRRERSFLPSPVRGQVPVPNVKPNSRPSVRSPFSTSTELDQGLTPLRAKRPQSEPLRSWSADDAFQYTPMKQPTRIVKRRERVVNEDGQETWVEVQREEAPQRLFLFPMAGPMAQPPP